MASEQMPVNPALITWARERAGLTPEEATAKFRKIAAWEAGDAGPTYPQLEDLAEAFDKFVAVFFFPTPPNVPSITEKLLYAASRAARQDSTAYSPASARQRPRHFKSALRNLMVDETQLCG